MASENFSVIHTSSKTVFFRFYDPVQDKIFDFNDDTWQAVPVDPKLTTTEKSTFGDADESLYVTSSQDLTSLYNSATPRTLIVQAVDDLATDEIIATGEVTLASGTVVTPGVASVQDKTGYTASTVSDKTGYTVSTVSDKTGYQLAADQAVNVTKLEGVSLAAKVGDNFNIFFNNAGGDTTKIVDNVGSGGGGGGGDATLAKQNEMLSKLGSLQTSAGGQYSVTQNTVDLDGNVLGATRDSVTGLVVGSSTVSVYADDDTSLSTVLYYTTSDSNGEFSVSVPNGAVYRLKSSKLGSTFATKRFRIST